MAQSTRYVGRRFQRGYGLFGSVLRGIAPMLKQIGKKALRTAARKGVSTVTKVARDVSRGVPLKKAVKKRARQAGAQMVNRILKSDRPINGRRPQQARIQPRKRVKRRNYG